VQSSSKPLCRTCCANCGASGCRAHHNGTENPARHGSNGLRRIGIREVAYRKGNGACVAVDHDFGRLVWARRDGTKPPWPALLDDLGARAERL
jgi:hypothetical protein